MSISLLGSLFDSGYPSDGMENPAVLVYRLLFITVAYGNRRIVFDERYPEQYAAAQWIFSSDNAVVLAFIARSNPGGRIDAYLAYPLEGNADHLQRLRQQLDDSANLPTAIQRELLISPLMRLGCEIDV